MNKAKLENFERAFSGGVNGCRRDCYCGKEFWDAYNEGYSWNEGEREALEKSKTAVPLSYAVGLVVFEGREYVDGCDCWHKRAEHIMAFIDAHDEQIARYLNLERERKIADATRVPVVKT